MDEPAARETDEQVAIVDSTGRVVGSAPRSTMRRDNLRHVVVAVLVRDPGGRVYVHRRTDTKDVFPGMHDCFAAGCMRYGEDPAAAAAREERLRRSRADAIAPLCVFLASEQSSYVNGQVFHQRAGELSLYGHMRPVRMVHRQGGWTPETIAEVAMPSLANHFTSLDSRNTHAGLPMD